MASDSTGEFKFWLREYRRRQDWSQTELGDKIGVTHVTIGQWEKGANRPEPEVLIKLAELSGRDPVFLFNEVYGLPLPTGDSAEDDRLMQIARKAAKLSDDTLEQLERFVDFLEQGERAQGKSETPKKTKTSVDSNK